MGHEMTLRVCELWLAPTKEPVAVHRHRWAAVAVRVESGCHACGARTLRFCVLPRGSRVVIWSWHVMFWLKCCKLRGQRNAHCTKPRVRIFAGKAAWCRSAMQLVGSAPCRPGNEGNSSEFHMVRSVATSYHGSSYPMSMRCLCTASSHRRFPRSRCPRPRRILPRSDSV